mgnify:CR=1 FL=1
MNDELVKRVNDLQRQVENLIKPELGRWVTIVPSLYQAAAVAATVNYARAFVENKKATIILKMTATAAGTVANNIYALLPAIYTPASGTTATVPLGEGTYLDGAVHYTCGVFYLAAIGGLPAFGLRVSTITDGNVIGANPSIAVASGDVFSFDVTFEI